MVHGSILSSVLQEHIWQVIRNSKKFTAFLGQFYHVSADVILLYSLFIKTNDGKPGCDFSNQKVWIWIWEIINILAIVGLIIALGELDILFSLKLKSKKKKLKSINKKFSGWYSWLGFWAMLHDPVHFVVFLIIVTILPLTIYLVFLVFVLYTYLKEAYIDVSF